MFLKTNPSSMQWLLRPARTRSVFILLVCLLWGFYSPAIDLVEKTVAVVNDEPIFLSDLNSLVKRLAKDSMVDDLLLFDSTPDKLKKDPKAQLQFLINEKILDSEVRRLNLAVTMDRVDQEISEIAKRNGISKAELIKTLQTQGIGVAEYQDFMKQRIERQSLVEQEVTARIRLSDEDVLAFYNSQAGKPSAKINEYSLSHIFFSPQQGGAEQALARANKVLALLKDGQRFESLQQKFSEDNDSAANGLLGTFKSGEFSSEMERAVRELNAGDTSEIVKSRSGFHILKLNQKKIVADPEFEKLKDRLRGQLFEKVFKRQFKAWLELKRDEASITLN